jgi:hypothetical protein
MALSVEILLAINGTEKMATFADGSFYSQEPLHPGSKHVCWSDDQSLWFYSTEPTDLLKEVGTFSLKYVQDSPDDFHL